MGKKGLTEKCFSSKCPECYSCTSLLESPSRIEAPRMQNEHLNMVSCILRNELHLGAYQHCVSHLLNARLKNIGFCDAKTSETILKTQTQ